MYKQVLLLICLTLLRGFANADFFISEEQLKEQGISYNLVRPINLSYKGDYFVTSTPITDLQLKSKGITQRLLIFRFENDSLSKIDKIDLPIVQMVNAAANHMKDQVLVIGNYGNKLLLVDLNDSTVKTIFEYRKRRPGFKCGPLIKCSHDKFYMTGWFYNSQKLWKGDYYVAVKILHKKEKYKARFAKMLNIGHLFSQKYKLVNRYNYASGQQIYFTQINPKERKTYLRAVRKNKVIFVDKAYFIGFFVGAHKRVYYPVQYKKGELIHHYVKDIQSGKKWDIGSAKKPFIYPFISAKAEVVVVTKPNAKKKTIQAFYGKAKNGYRLKTFMKNVSMGPMKLSGNGKVCLLMQKDGIKVCKLK